MLMRKFMLVMVLVFAATCASAETLSLPAPEKTGGMSLLDALTARRTDHEFAEGDFTLQELSNLLYATGGVNRPDGKRVYPVGLGVYDMDIYVFIREGVYKYDAQAHALELIKTGDYRQSTGKQDFVGKAAVNLAYVQDMDAWSDKPVPKDAEFRMGMNHAGALMQNAYLFAASQGWNAVVRGSFDAKAVSEILGLKDSQTIALIHTIGKRP